MNLVIDANILFAALIKNSTTAELLFNENLHFFAPEFLFIELEKYREEILEKTERTPEEFSIVLSILKNQISIVPTDEFQTLLEHARAISPDPDDILYFALALKLKCPIWSNDKVLKSQQKVAVCSTEDLIKLLSTN